MARRQKKTENQPRLNQINLESLFTYNIWITFVFVSGCTILLCIDQISRKYENLLPLESNVF